jgi:hypothetical protein
MPHYVDTLLCEMIRAEQNNKLSIMGLFGKGIFLQEIPAMMPSFAVLQRWEPTEAEPAGTRLNFSLRLIAPDGTQLFALPPGEVAVPQPPDPMIQIGFQSQGLLIAARGNYEVVTLIDHVERHRYRFFIDIPTPEQRRQLQGFPPI